MYSGELMPPKPIRPMKNPWPIHSGYRGPSVEIARPTAIITEPRLTVQLVPIRSARRIIRMPPAPLHNQARAVASPGTERAPPTSAAMSLSATVVIQAPPNAMVRMTSAVKAIRQDCFVSIDEMGEGGIDDSGESFYVPGVATPTHFPA